MYKKSLLVSFSGGRTSAFMTWWLMNMWKKRDEYDILVVFANTGREREETLYFVRQCDRYYGFKTVWVEAVTNPEFGEGTTAKVVNYKTASRNGEPFEQMIKKYGIPNRNFPHCSRELKRNAIRSYCKSIGWDDYETAIGIRSDEVSRINWANAKRERLIYPLVTMIRVVKSDINLHWSKQPFDLKLKSYEGNCKDCWKKALRKLLTLAKQDPSMLDWTTEMEQLYGYYVPETRKADVTPPIRFFRGNRTAEDIIEESKFPFIEAIDESKLIDKWKQSAFWDLELDGNDGCSESCEAF